MLYFLEALLAPYLREKLIKDCRYFISWVILLMEKEFLS